MDMVSELQAASEIAVRGTHGVWIAEFGLVENQHLEPERTYCGRLYRLSPEQSKAVSESAGFSARFDMSAVRTACMDVYKTEGSIIFEIERNSKPGDVSLRRAGDRWNVQELMDKSADGLRPWRKYEYKASFLPDKVLSQVAEALQISPDDKGKLFLRVNFKERTFGIIADEKYPEVFPSGDFAAFVIPPAPPGMKSASTEQAEAHISTEEPAQMSESQDARDAQEAPAAQDSQEPRETQDAQQSPEAQQVPEAPGPLSESPAVENNASGAGRPPGAQESADTQPAPGSETEAAASAGESTQEPVAAPDVPAPAPEPERPAPQERPAPARPPAERSYSSPSPRRESAEAQPKYATYSMSEVDRLLKQQAESLAGALGGKIAQQQRATTEALAAQDKTFARLSETFMRQFEQARQKLEKSTQDTQSATTQELAEFRKQLARELEQFRTQINKTVLPVTKALEDKPQKVTREQKVEVTTRSATRSAAQRDPLVVSLLVLILVAAVAGTVGLYLPRFTEQSAAPAQQAAPATPAAPAPVKR
jgi:hypothetical protein